jgi:RNA polymerase-binding transcription factor DksA
MKEKLLKELKANLEESRKALVSELEKFAKKDEKIKDDWDTRYPKPGSGSGGEALEDAAGKVEEYATLLPIEYSLELRLRDINLALGKIKKDKYGKCEKCGKNIREERLKAYPAARFCSKCENR